MLHLVLKYHWYDLISNGVKKEEYREIKPFYEKRIYARFFALASCPRCIVVRPFKVCLHRGYTNQYMVFQVERLRIGRGRIEWGAPPDKDVFIFELGERLPF